MTFQKRVLNWLMECFSNDVCRDGVERNHRFLEESLELVQSLGCTQSEAHQLVDYVFGRPVGEPTQELGGVMVTVSALASCHDMDLNDAAEIELERVWKNIEKIRAKQLAKPKHSPLPAVPADDREEFGQQVRAIAIEECCEIVQAIDSGRGNEKEILKAIRALRSDPPPTADNREKCSTCKGRGYVVEDGDWEPRAIQCPDCVVPPPESAKGSE